WDGQPRYGNEPLFVCWTFGWRMRPLFIPRGDLESIRMYWCLVSALGVNGKSTDPAGLIRRRKDGRDLAARAIADLCEAGAYGVDIAKALAVFPQRISERQSYAEQLLGRSITRRPTPQKSRTAIDEVRGLEGSDSPHPNSMWSRHPELQATIMKR